MNGVPIRVQASAYLCCRLELEKLCRDIFLNCELRSHSKELRIEMRPRAIVKLKESGTASIDGLLTVEEARLALKKVARRCKKLFSKKVKFRDFFVETVKWAEHYQPDFPIDILKLSDVPGSEVRGDEEKPGAGRGRRVIVPCSKVRGLGGEGADGQDAEAAQLPNSSSNSSSRAPGPKKSLGPKFFVEGSYMQAGSQGEGAGDGDELLEEEEVPDAGIFAEVHADGRTMFWGAKSLQELEESLEIMQKLFEENRLENTDMASLYKKRKSSSQLGGNVFKKRMTEKLSAESLDLAAPSFDRDFQDDGSSDDDEFKATGAPTKTPMKKDQRL